MLKRSYMVFSLVIALSIGALALGSASFADEQKDKAKDNAGQKEKEKPKDQKDVERLYQEAQLLAEPGFSFATIAGPGAYLGVYLEEVTAERAKELKLADERGAIVMKVSEGSPAEKAGFKENDVIVSFNGRRVDTVRELQRLLGETPTGRTVSFDLIRGGSQQSIQATLTKRSPNLGVWHQGLYNEQAFKQSEEAMKRSADAMKRSQELLKLRGNLEQSGKAFKGFEGFNFVAPGGFAFYRGSRLGISVESLTDQLAEYFGVKGGHGVLVAEVRENSAAAKAGLKAGDVITAVDGQKVDDVSALLQAINKKQEGTLTLTIVRNRSEQTVTVTVEKSERRPLQRPRTRMIAV